MTATTAVTESNSREIPAAPLRREASLLRMSSDRTRLLVSVRSVQEAERALAGGADILDMKEPSRGSLGMARIDDIACVSNLPAVAAEQVSLSVALGELSDWRQVSNRPTLPANVSLAKMGLSHCRSDSLWQRHWQEVRADFERESSRQIGWVAVAYADATEAESPSIGAVLHAAISTGCVGLLIDTWTKDGRTLLSEIDAASLTTIANNCHDSGLFLALAGNLQRSSLPELSNLPADVLAIRSAACCDHDRKSDIDSDRIRQFKTDMLARRND